ncbi:two-partner secretion domain-containing protein [Hydrogenophaga sp. PBC]|uniref:two-partner secretion domain-containing protein n=1 Tax=Hydrogenophaga sp. PBC TaxID=795665 RepID=UPI001314EB77|nr:filamentous hemagglutinin N-terminal domain-containing protein [Hydrogenophaga sp. PBC]
MKQKHHRVVFKPARGLPRTVHWAVTLALSSPLSSPQAWSQILADPSAPGSQRPTILGTGNGVPLINITTPSAAGVSRNTYRQFDVGSPGAILNNSRTGAQSQLGGPIPGNPWLATGPARVILSEVNSSKPSFLNGPIEVAVPARRGRHRQPLGHPGQRLHVHQRLWRHPHHRHACLAGRLARCLELAARQRGHLRCRPGRARRRLPEHPLARHRGERRPVGQLPQGGQRRQHRGRQHA